MTAFVERLVQMISESAPIEDAVSNLVAGVLETTATRLAGGEALQADHAIDQESAA